jgi:hypothetical protein
MLRKPGAPNVLLLKTPARQHLIRAKNSPLLHGPNTLQGSTSHVRTRRGVQRLAAEIAQKGGWANKSRQ